LGTPGGSPLYITTGYLDGNPSSNDINNFVNQWGVAHAHSWALVDAGLGLRPITGQQKWGLAFPVPSLQADTRTGSGEGTVATHDSEGGGGVDFRSLQI
jgi:hypothetical protein